MGSMTMQRVIICFLQQLARRNCRSTDLVACCCYLPCMVPAYAAAEACIPCCLRGTAPASDPASPHHSAATDKHIRLVLHPTMDVSLIQLLQHSSTAGTTRDCHQLHGGLDMCPAQLEPSCQVALSSSCADMQRCIPSSWPRGQLLWTAAAAYGNAYQLLYLVVRQPELLQSLCHHLNILYLLEQVAAQ